MDHYRHNLLQKSIIVTIQTYIWICIITVYIPNQSISINRHHLYLHRHHQNPNLQEIHLHLYRIRTEQRYAVDVDCLHMYNFSKMVNWKNHMEVHRASMFDP